MIDTPVTIGREEGNVVQLNDDRVSRFHLKIQEDQERLVLTDLESTNGTKVNGEDIQLRILRHGDMICVGRSILLFGSPNEIEDRVATMRGDVELEKTGDFEAALQAFMDSSHGEVIKRINETGDYDDEIEAGLKAALDDFKANHSW